MKKSRLFFTALVIGGAMSVTSCGGGIDGEKVAEEFCECADLEGDEKAKCHDDFVEKYKGARGTEEEGEKMGKKMAECDPFGALEVLTRMAE